MMEDRCKYIPIFEQEPGVRAFFSTKYCTVEGGPNGAIFEKPELFAELGLADYVRVWPRQVHGTDIAVIRAEDVERFQEERASRTTVEDTGKTTSQHGIRIPETDGTLTNVEQVLLISVHADCLPVYLYDPSSRAIGMVHAGWRGAVAGIVPKAIAKLQEDLGAKASTTKLYIGPGISKCCFEVGGEVAAQFLEQWGNSFADPQDPKLIGQPIDINAKYMLDLKAAVKAQAIGAGILEENIGVSEHCTFCEPELFCSYRREGGTYMRMGAGICLVD